MRAVITALVVAAIAGVVIYGLHSRDAAIQQSQQKQISQLNSKLATLQTQNENLKNDLATVQTEQQSLVAQNQALNKAIAQYMATGKMPGFKMPYPPK